MRQTVGPMPRGRRIFDINSAAARRVVITYTITDTGGRTDRAELEIRNADAIGGCSI